MNPDFYSGTSGLLLPVPNKQYYPEEFKNKSRLSYYGALFKSIEINSSFYKVPMAATVKKWADEVPETFRFTFKLWREITHNKGLLYNPSDVGRFMQVIGNAGHKAGCLLIQFPPGHTSAYAGQLKNLLEDITAADSVARWRLAVEFRHSSWYSEAVYQLLESYRAALVVHDMPSSATPSETLESDFMYLRFHGPGGRYRGGYSNDFLHEYALYIKDWLKEGKTVYTYFNNTAGDAVHNLAFLNHAVIQDN